MSLFDAPSLIAWAHAVRAGDPLLVEGLTPAAKAALIAAAARAVQRPVLVVTPNARTSRLLENLPFFHIDATEFPHWETLPGEDVPPSPDIAGRRLQILDGLRGREKPPLLVASLQACLQKVPSPDQVHGRSRTLRKGEEWDLYKLAADLEQLGYQRRPVTADKGHYSIRGGILDIFPLSAAEPCRLEFFGDTLESLRLFDPISQRSVRHVDELFICPGSEQILLTKTELLLHYLDRPLVVFDGLLPLEDQAVALQQLPGANSPLCATMSEWLGATEQLPTIYLSDIPVEELSETSRKGSQISWEWLQKRCSASRYVSPFVPVTPFLFPEPRAHAQEEAVEQLRHWGAPLDVHIPCAHSVEEKQWQALFDAAPLPPPLTYTFESGYLSEGFALPEERLLYLPQTEFTHRVHAVRTHWRTTYHAPLAEFQEFLPGE